MEEVHPIPQNVTSFQFKLVGDMTLKQFGYLASGSGFAYFIFVFFARDYPLIAWPIVVFSALLGVAFAFVPVGSRPLDRWLSAFLKAVYSPTKRVWAKNGKIGKGDPLFNSRLVMYLTGLYGAPASQQDAGAPEFLPTPEELKKTVDLAREAQVLQMKIIQSERTLSQIKQHATETTPIPVDYSQQVSTVVADLKNLVSQASDLKEQIKSVQEQIAEPAAAPEPVTKEKVKIVMPVKPKQAQVALTTFPNVINGIVADGNKNYLEGVIAVIYDKEGLPVRALKTNKLGQFTGSTPLPSGTYTLELEKEDYVFDVLQIELSGEVLPPLLITAK